MSQLRRNAPVPQATDADARQRLITAATELFAAKGFATTSVREIVDGAGVTKPTLYYHFRSKEGIYLALLGQILEEFEERLGGVLATPGTPWQRIRRLCLGMFRLAEDRLPLMRLMYAVYYGPRQETPEFDFDVFQRRLEATIRSLLDEAVAAGEVAPGQVADKALAVVGLTSIAVDMAVCHPERQLGRAELERMLDTLFTGVRAMPQKPTTPQKKTRKP